VNVDTCQHVCQFRNLNSRNRLLTRHNLYTGTYALLYNQTVDIDATLTRERLAFNNGISDSSTTFIDYPFIIQ